MTNYKITKTNTLEFYREDSESPDVAFLVMEKWPSGDAWDSKETAENWAKLFVASQLEGATHRPGDSPAEPSVEIVYPEVVEEIVEETTPAE